MVPKQDSPYHQGFTSRGRPVSRLRSGLVAAAVAVVALLSVPGTAAAEPTLTVSPSSGLDPDGAFVVVSGWGYPANAQLFVMQCRSTSTDDHVCNSVGLRKVTTDANGNFTANAMRLVARFGATDCTTTACSVMTSAVSGHSGDRSLDRATAVTFAAPAQPAPPPPTEPAPLPPPPAPETPAPGAPATPDTTAAAGDTTSTSADPGSIVPSTTTTTVADEPEEAGSGGSEAETADGEIAGADDGDPSEAAVTLTGAGSDDDDGDGGVGGAAVLALAVAALAATAGGAFLLQRRRGTATT